eukprot:Seg2491.1 transcript_id=Seg2491.1/GoldUCD/mRNA.D3Y31 product="Cation-dependent mannose-6-phosphate receptor" protein_id=Seg2491.1/GoldUCD/D3Y31
MAAEVDVMRLMIGLFVCLISPSMISATCGPLGFEASDLLKPAYWYFDISNKECNKFPKPKAEERMVPANGTNHYCRFYMHICKAMQYQCSGTVCLRYLYTDDYVALLGYEKEKPFSEDHTSFSSSFIGDNSLCKNGLMETNLIFNCDKTAKWNTTVTHNHGGASSPHPVNLQFDAKSCKLNVYFNYSGACEKYEKGYHRGTSMSVGSILLILFFPGLALYFIIGVLINRMAGHRGKEMIPHGSFWLGLPDLIMDGFVFTMATVTCRQHEARTTYESM